MILKEHFLWEEKTEKNIITTTIPTHNFIGAGFPSEKIFFFHWFFFFAGFLWAGNTYSFPVLNVYF